MRAQYEHHAHQPLEKADGTGQGILSLLDADAVNVGVENVDGILKDEIGKVFSKVLEHAGVYKRTDEGKAAFDRFAAYVNEN